MPSGLIRFAVAGFLAIAAALGPHAGLRPADDARARRPRARRPGASSSKRRRLRLKRQRPPSPPKRPPRPILRRPLPRLGSPPSQRGRAKSSTGETVDLPARPFAYIEGKADKDEIYSAILNSLSLVKREMDKASLAPAGRPLAVFVESDDTGFKYHAGYPIAAAPEGKTSLSDAVKIGQTPSGKAMRFEHQGAYGDIDATYDAITAYLDDKGIDAQDSFIEEYANDVKDPDDPTLQVNIYVLLK